MSGSGRARYQTDRPTIAHRTSVTIAAAAVALPVGRSRRGSALARSSGAGLSFTSVIRCLSPAARVALALITQRGATIKDDRVRRYFRAACRPANDEGERLAA